MKISPGKAASITSLLLLLFFPNFLVLLGYTVNESIFLGIVAGLSGGLIAGWSHTEPEVRQLEETKEKAKEKVEYLSVSETTESFKDSSLSEDENQNENVSDSDFTEYSSARETSGTYNINNSENSSQLPRNYELKFIESVLPKQGEKAENKSSEKKNANSKKLGRRNEASTRARRKGVSLFSWFLMKEGDSSKSHRR